MIKISLEKSKRPKKNIKTSNVILTLVAIFLLLFTAGMITVFIFKDSVPDVLITCVFAACMGEFSVLGWIKTTKVKSILKEEDEG